jgi:hypothetical protein
VPFAFRTASEDDQNGVRSRASSVNDLPLYEGESETATAGLMLCAAAAIAALLGGPAFAPADLAGATAKLSLRVATEMPGERCRRVEAQNAEAFASVSLHRTFTMVAFEIDRKSAYQIDER